MNYSTKNISLTVQDHLSQMKTYFLGLFIASISLSVISCSSPNDAIEELKIDPILQQAVFESPEQAAQSFFSATANNDRDKFSKILGAGFRDVLPKEDISSKEMTNFVTAWENEHSLLADGEQIRFIAIGKQQWTLPIPIVASESGWFFDVEQGIEIINIRRIGRNELNTMQILLAYHDAQQEYFEQDRDDDGILEYAQKLVSTPETHDGLFWDGNSSDKVQRLKALLVDKGPGGSHNGYHFKALNAQGEAAEGGASSYIVNEALVEGFAVIAWPKDYGISGVMSFLINHNGVLFEQNLGSEGSEIIKGINTYNPDSDWTQVEEETLAK